MSLLETHLKQKEVLRSGAGGGKTTALISKVKETAENHKKNHGAYPRMVVSTFTKKATKEIRERILEKSMDSEEFLEFTSSSDLFISTLHGVCGLFLRRYGHLAGLESYEIVSDEFSKAELSRILLKRKEDPEIQFLISELKFSKLRDLIYIWSMENLRNPNLRMPGVKDWRVSEENLSEKSLKLWKEQIERENSFEEETESFFKVFERVSKKISKEFLEWKRTTGQLVMNDLENFSYQVLTKYPKAAQQFCKDWDYWFIDEYQDTSPIQVKILSLFIQGRPEFVVGDPQQSIYSFRGAQRGVFEARVQDVKSQGGDVTQRLKNYRSKPELLEFFNDVFSSQENFDPMEPRESNLNSAQNVATFCPIFLEKGDNAQGLEEQALVLKIQELLKKGVERKDICVLVRKNGQALKVSQYLSNSDIPVFLTMSGDFSQRREILDALSILKFMMNPHDNQNLILLLRSPWYHMEDSEISHAVQAKKKSEKSKEASHAVQEKKQSEESKHFSHWEFFKKLSHPTIQRLQVLLERSEMASAGLVQVWQESLVESGLMDMSFVYDPSGVCEANLWKLVMRLKAAIREKHFNIHEFCQSNLKGTSGGDEEGGNSSSATSAIESNRVQVMTIHKAKGLEFDHVLVPFCGQRLMTSSGGFDVKLLLDHEGQLGTFAIQPQGAKQGVKCPLGEKVTQEKKAQHHEEALRLFYVALTRAKASVFLSWTEEKGKKALEEVKSWKDVISRAEFDLSLGTHQTKSYSYTVTSSKRENFQSLPSLSEKKVKLSEPWRPRSFYESSEIQLDQVGASGQTNVFSVGDLIEKPGAQKPVPTSVVLKLLSSQQRGLRLHSLLEGLRYQQDLVFPENMQKPKDFVLDLKEPPMKELLLSGHAEWGFQVQTKTGLLQGQVDLWGVHDGVLWVVDYKSSSTLRDLDKTFEQLSLYAWALVQSGQKGTIQLAAVYPMKEKAHVQALPDPQTVGKKYSLI